MNLLWLLVLVIGSGVNAYHSAGKSSGGVCTEQVRRYGLAYGSPSFLRVEAVTESVVHAIVGSG